jgi:hypothetical protein
MVGIRTSAAPERGLFLRTLRLWPRHYPAWPAQPPEEGTDINAAELGRKNAHNPFPLSEKDEQHLRSLGPSSWLEYLKAKAQAEGKPLDRTSY